MAKALRYLISVALLVVVSLTNAQDPCRPASCRGSLHTLCQFRSPFPSPQCGNVKTSQVTPRERAEILNLHNELRAKVARGDERRGNPGPQPRGRIGPLQWDEKLAEVAQRWANQCNFGHDQCRHLAAYNVGQNVAIQSYSDDYREGVLTAQINSWYDEVADFNRNSVRRFQWQSSPQIGHYTQLVWGKTTHVGCGVVRYYSSDRWYNTYLVCNYGPAGNIIGTEMYETF